MLWRLLTEEPLLFVECLFVDICAQHFDFQVGVRGNQAVVIGVEKRSVATLQDQRTISKISLLDEHVIVAFAGPFLFVSFPRMRLERQDSLLMLVC